MTSSGRLRNRDLVAKYVDEALAGPTERLTRNTVEFRALSAMASHTTREEARMNFLRNMMRDDIATLRKHGDAAARLCANFNRAVAAADRI